MLTQKQRENLSKYFDNNEFEDKEALAIYPFRYEMRIEKDESEWKVGEDIIFTGTIVSKISIFRKSYKQAFVRFQVQTAKQVYQVISFNPYLSKNLENKEVTIIGKLNKTHEILATTVNTKPLESQTGILPVYPLKSDIKQFQMRAIMTKIVKENKDTLQETIPKKFIEAYKLQSTPKSIVTLHQPKSLEHLQMALRTLKYGELLEYQTALQVQKTILQKDHKPPKQIEQSMLDEVIHSLPYELTDDQVTVLTQIQDDMASNHTMTRLLQGDVGSGKTILAILSALIALNSGYQVAILCPTEVLMMQHYETFKEILPNKFTVNTLTSSKKDKTIIQKQLQSGQLDIVIGTHILFSESTTYHNLGYVVIDEQHRFGVSQRQGLLNKGAWVDTLMMSATPIPRTLASSLYAHLEVSTLSTMPRSRQPIETVLIEQNSMMPIMDQILKRIENNDQVYVVCPAIDESVLNLRNVHQIYKELNKRYGHQLNIDMIHGELDSDTTKETLDRFRNREIDILVTTTVIEVGVHVAQANTMVIYNADRFGLAQIHQLRGRLGRAGIKGVCYLLTDSQEPESLKRLQYLNETSDGFELAYFDLKTRGAGDILGTRQSGIPHFLHSDILSDQKILNQAKEDASELIMASDTESVQYVLQIRDRMESILMQAAI